MDDDLPPLPPGFQRVSGKRGPRKHDERYRVQFRNGWIDRQGTYPAKGPRWEWNGDDWDIVAVKRA